MSEQQATVPPRNLKLRGGIWYVDVRRGRSGRVRLSTRTADLAAATETAKALCATVREDDIERWREFLPADDKALLAYLFKGLERARKRDRKRERVCELTPDNVRALLARSGGKCELTGIRFSLEKANGTWRRPFAPSFDRISRSEPYRLENCRLVCVAANIGLNEWGEAVFRRIAVGFLVRSGTHVPTIPAVACR